LLLLLLFSVRYRCIWGRCGRCGVSWHPCRQCQNGGTFYGSV